MAKQFRVSVGDAVRVVDETQLEAACAKLTAGGHAEKLQVEEVLHGPGKAEWWDLKLVPASAEKVLEQGAIMARLTEQERLASEAGFSPRPPIYALGTRVNETGVENARRSRLEHDQKPTVLEAMVTLRDHIALENRRDRVVKLSDARLRENGNLLVKVPANGSPSHTVELALAERAFDSFVARAGIKGADYLKRCWPELRAYNVNAWLDRFGRANPKAAFTFRVRQNPEIPGGNKREVFAVVSERYQGGFGIDQIAEALAAFAPEDARGATDYDGFRAKIECLWHSDAKAEEYAAGEMFKAGIVVRSDDTGGGSIQVSAVVWRNLCLNLIVIDEATIDVGRIRHIGELKTLQDRFYEAGALALQKIDGFRRAWGSAQADVVTRDNPECQGLSISQVLPGLFQGAIERELVPVRGKRQEVLKALVQAYDREPVKHAAPTRSDMVNAFTRYAHEVESDPFAAFEIEKAAGALLFGRAAKQRWPYEPVSAS